MNLTFWGIWSMGFVFGYLLYYSLRRTQNFSIELLSSAIGAVGGGTVVGLFGKTEGWIGPYGVGLLCGFIFYLILALIAFATGTLTALTGGGVLLRTMLLGAHPLSDAVVAGIATAGRAASEETRSPRR